jgi:hypothetical protein
VDQNDLNKDQSFPLRDVTLCLVDKTLSVKDPLQAGIDWQASQNEFAMQIKGVGDFYACRGSYVEFKPVEGADPEWIKLCLRGRIMVALLHQRRTVSFHASSFIHNNRGLMILGDSGAGKSSLTASFVLNGAGFLTDDLTPVIVKNSIAYIWPIPGSVKIWEDTASQLNISRRKLKPAEQGTGKHYFELTRAGFEECVLKTILKIDVGTNKTIEFYEPEPALRFSILRSEICSWELLAGMPETENDYLHQLLKIVQQVSFIRIVRPAEIGIQKLHSAIADHLMQID